jgi:hypothetical protein
MTTQAPIKLLDRPVTWAHVMWFCVFRIVEAVFGEAVAFAVLLALFILWVIVLLAIRSAKRRSGASA